jgi:hypothetical protein
MLAITHQSVPPVWSLEFLPVRLWARPVTSVAVWDCSNWAWMCDWRRFQERKTVVMSDTALVRMKVLAGELRKTTKHYSGCGSYWPRSESAICWIQCKCTAVRDGSERFSLPGDGPGDVTCCKLHIDREIYILNFFFFTHFTFWVVGYKEALE